MGQQSTTHRFRRSPYGAQAIDEGMYMCGKYLRPDKPSGDLIFEM